MTKTYHSIVVGELKKLGENKEFKTDKSGKEIISLKKEGYRIKPDVVWEKEGKIKYIFEVDKGAYDNYPKTIYGSMLTGIILSKKYGWVFYEVTFKSKNSEKVKKILELFKKNILNSKKLRLIILPYRNLNSAERNYYWDLSKEIE
ncbi:MAG: hypothetical protein KJ771_07070 [Nanoarchaeota archaeon]|nr:hypothetical protein [Nanoarchaeota archaeon]